MTMKDNSTICAIATASGAGGVAVIRISGSESIAIANKIYFPIRKNHSLHDQKSYSLSYGRIMNDEEALDEILIAVFRAPNSFTGEDTVEIFCHGSVYIQQEILKILLKNGCRMAHPGEFTQRAFLNGKMDLSQAEAVADLIASSSKASHCLAFHQMKGGFSHELSKLREQLLNFVSLMELELDFGEEDVKFADRMQLIELAANIKQIISKLVESFGVGNVIKNGIPVVIVGETNAGKSTLLNHLLNEEKAIVSHIHGTTRDVIEDVMNINGINFRFIDTAGIRDSQDEIENLGIERTFEKIKQASIVVWMIDTTQFSEKIESVADRIVPKTKDKKLIIVFNKIDKISEEEQTIMDEEFLPDVSADRIYLSVKYKKNTKILEDTLLKAANLPEINQNDVIVTNMRHYEALTKALDSINRVEQGLQQNLSGDLIVQDIRECMHYLGEITGEISTDEILGTIFSKFCIGK